MKVLEGIRILDWTVLQQGSICSTLLADLGADVIKIEDPRGGDMGRLYDDFFGIKGTLPKGSTYYFEFCNRNKRGITLNLKHKKGLEILNRLVETSDVFVQNFRVGVAEKLGLDYETLKKINPSLIYTHATGMGSCGDEATEPLIDYGALARSGLMWTLGSIDPNPAPAQGALCDQSGAIFAAYGTLAALLLRERTGIGQQVQSSLLGGIIGLNWIDTSMAGWSGQGLPRFDRKHPANVLSNYYRCKDGQWLMLGCYMEKYFERFFRLIDRMDVAENPRFFSPEKRSDNLEELVAIMEDIFARRDRDDWLRLLRGADMICEPVRHTIEILEDQQAFANGYLVNYHHPRFDQDIVVIGSPVLLGESPVDIQRPAPLLGEHNNEVLRELGYSSKEIEGFAQQEII